MLDDLIASLDKTVENQNKLTDFAILLIDDAYSLLIDEKAQYAFRVAKHYLKGKATKVELQRAYERAWEAKNAATDDIVYYRNAIRAVSLLLGWITSEPHQRYTYCITKIAKLYATAYSAMAEWPAQSEQAKRQEELKQIDLFRSIFKDEC